MNWNDLTFKRWKLLSDVAKLQKSSNYNELHRFDVKTIKKCWVTSQNNASDHIIIIASIWRQNDQNFWVRLQNYKSNQITMDCIDLTVKRSKQRKTTNKRDQITINLHRFDVKTLKRSKMLSDVAKQQKSSNYNELHRVDVRTIKNVELRRKTFKTTQNYKTDQIIMYCIDLTSKRSKMLSYVAKHSKQRKTTKVIIL